MGLTAVNRTVSWLFDAFDVRKSTVSPVQFPPQKPLFTPITVQQSFERKTPEACGISATHIERFIEDLRQEPTLNMHSLLILRGNAVIAEVTFGAQDMRVPKMTFSVCKSITSLAVGMLIEDGKLTLDSRVVEFFPDKTTAVSRLRYKDLTVEHLLTMTSGISFNEAESMMQTDWVRACFNSAPQAKAGKQFAYNSLNTYLLSAIIRRISGQTLTEFLQKRLWEPLGITDFFWETCPEGVEKGGWGLYLSAEDLAKIGRLFLQKGIWNKRRLIDETYLQVACTAHQEAPMEYGDFNYGYHLWVGRETPTLLLNGMLGQNVLMFPDTDILLVTHAGNDEMFQQSRYYSLAQQYFGGAFPAVLPENRMADKHLKDVITACGSTFAPQRKPLWWQRFRLPFVEDLPEECNTLNGVVLTAVSPNAASAGLLPVMLQTMQSRYATGCMNVRFEVIGERFCVTYCERNESYRFDVGFEKPIINELRFQGEPYRVAVKGRFAHNEYEEKVLILTLDFLETPCTRTLKIVWGTQGVQLFQTERPSIPFLLSLLSEIKQKLDEKPFIGAAVDKLDEDFVLYKIKGVFAPVIQLEK